MNVARRAGPLLMINPSTDRELGQLARGLVIDAQATPETLEAALRPLFPRLVVHRRELSGEDVQIWYVYREGHWVSTATADPAASRPELKARRRD